MSEKLKDVNERCISIPATDMGSMLASSRVFPEIISSYTDVNGVRYVRDKDSGKLIVQEAKKVDAKEGNYV